MRLPRSQDTAAGHHAAQDSVPRPQRTADQEFDEPPAEGAGRESRREEPLDRRWRVDREVPASLGEARDHPIKAGLPETGHPKLTGNPGWRSRKRREWWTCDLPIEHAFSGETAGYVAQPDVCV